MPHKGTINPNAAMLWPRVQTIKLAGEKFRVSELRVRDIADIEDGLERVFPHPHSGIEREIATWKDRDNPEMDRIERIKAGVAISTRTTNWPPSFGSDDFHEALVTTIGSQVFLKVMLRRFNQGITKQVILDLMALMDVEDWVRIEKVAWGHRRWMSGGEPSKDSKDGIKWNKEVETLSKQRGWTYETIGNMTLGQFFNARCAGEPISVWISDLKSDSNLPI